MKIFQNRFLVGFFFFALGAASMSAAQYYIQNKGGSARASVASANTMNPLFDRFFDEDFFGRSNDPFDDMRRMRESMLKQFNHEEGGGLFDTWYKKRFGGGSAGDVARREDANFIYYDISVQGLKNDKVNIKVENGNIFISGQVEQKNEDGDSSSYMSSSFHRSFPVPSNVDANQVKIEQGKGTLVVKFPKVDAKST